MSEAAVNGLGRTRALAARHDATLGRTFLIAALVCAGYYLTAKIGFAFTLQPGSVSILWMPNSILLAALLITPKRSWWIVLAAALPAHFAAELLSGVPTAMVLSWFVSNSVQALIGAVCINYLIDGPLRFDSFKHLTIFLLFGAFLAPFVSSFLDIALVTFNSWGHGSFWESWRIRFLSNVLATLALVPVIVTWVCGGFKAAKKVSFAKGLEAGVLAVGLFVVGNMVFSSQASIADITPSLLYWPLPFLFMGGGPIRTAGNKYLHFSRDVCRYLGRDTWSRAVYRQVVRRECSLYSMVLDRRSDSAYVLSRRHR